MSNIVSINEIHKEIVVEVFKNFEEKIKDIIRTKFEVTEGLPNNLYIENIINNNVGFELLKRIYEFEASVVCINVARKISNHLKGNGKGYPYINGVVKYKGNFTKGSENYLTMEDILTNKKHLIDVIVNETMALQTFMQGNKKVVGSYSYMKEMGLLGNERAEQLKDICQFNGVYSNEQYEKEYKIITESKGVLKKLESDWKELKKDSDIKLLIKIMIGNNEPKYFENTLTNIHEALYIAETKRLFVLPLVDIVNGKNQIFLEKNQKTMNGHELYKQAREKVYDDFKKDTNSLSIIQFKKMMDIFMPEIYNKNNNVDFILRYIEGAIERKEATLNAFNISTEMKQKIVTRESVKKLLNGEIVFSEKEKAVKEFIYKEEIYKNIFRNHGLLIFKETSNLDCVIKHNANKKIKVLLTGDIDLISKISAEFFIKELYEMHEQFAEENIGDVGKMFLRTLELKALTTENKECVSRSKKKI